MHLGSVAVLGSANMDLVTQQPRLPLPGETIAGSTFTTGPGGKGLNQAVAARRAGVEVTFIGAVGSDGFGSELRSFLDHEGVGTDTLRTIEGPTGIAIVSVVDGGENSIVIVAGANGADDISAADEAGIRSSSLLVAQLERPLTLIEKAFALAKDGGATTVLTPAPVDADAVRLLPFTDILVPNETEAIELSGEGDAQSAARALSRQVGIVVTTLGAKGAIVATGGEIVATVAAHPADAVDTTGAGDTFVGAMVAALARGDELSAALAAASAAGAIAVTRFGAAPAAPTREEIDAFLAEA
ncbi:ribokinase [Microbacterium amylolyticum]|uniref:Ribokinase n=1 Tax=Microbacterium amylolyticum TaxID=936337 RepID=A0ABS4ZJ05_9MICO|nr:ribokinase [Microbacterium amylolyticum]MBP2437272.1 ribokinase [Microbacterium amylolyticum]